MPFSTASPAHVSIAVDVVDDAKPMDWYPASKRSLSLSTYLLSNGSLPESKENDIVILGTRAVKHRFLDDEGKIELMGKKGSSDKEVELEVDLEEVKETVKEEVKEQEPDKEWQATGTWPSWSNNKGKEWGWGGNAQLMANNPWGPADPVTLDLLDFTLRTMDWNVWTMDGNVQELVRRACHQARIAQDHHVSSILVGIIFSADLLLVFPSPLHLGFVCSDELYRADVAGQSVQHSDGSSHWGSSD